MVVTRYRRTRGFTLIEVIIVVSVMAILAAVALPSYSRMIQRHDIAKVARNFESSLRLAQRHAYVSGRPVTVCPVLDVTASLPMECSKWEDIIDSSNAGDPGWIVFNDDSSGTGVGKIESDETIFDRSSFGTSKVSVIWTNPRSPKITLTPRNTSGTSGTMRLSSAGSGGVLPTWSSSNPPDLSHEHLETRVKVSSLGKITYEK